MKVGRILVPVDFSPCSDVALEWALSMAETWGAEVEILHVWSPRVRAIFAETPEGLALAQRLSAAENAHAARVSGRLEFGEDPSTVILSILARERFDLVVLGSHGDGGRAPSSGHVATQVATVAPCKVVRLGSTGEPEAA